jgi:hypothetical protein
MRLIYHPDAEAELIEAARFYEQRVPSLGGQFLDAAELATGAILDAPQRWSLIEGWSAAIPDAAIPLCGLLPCLSGACSHSRVQASQP